MQTKLSGGTLYQHCLSSSVLPSFSHLPCCKSFRNNGQFQDIRKSMSRTCTWQVSCRCHQRILRSQTADISHCLSHGTTEAGAEDGLSSDTRVRVNRPKRSMDTRNEVPWIGSKCRDSAPSFREFSTPSASNSDPPGHVRAAKMKEETSAARNERASSRDLCKTSGGSLNEMPAAFLGNQPEKSLHVLRQTQLLFGAGGPKRERLPA